MIIFIVAAAGERENSANTTKPMILCTPYTGKNLKLKMKAAARRGMTTGRQARKLKSQNPQRTVDFPVSD